MERNNKNGLLNLRRKATAIFGTAMAALLGSQNISAAVPAQQFENIGGKTIQAREMGKVKPMPVFKLNGSNLANGKFVAQHSSHSSHSSHNSHSSHYSHRSGGMVS
jgi:hypothetical protein